LTTTNAVAAAGKAAVVVVSAELVYAVACATLKPRVLSASSDCGPLTQVLDVHS
jgi:hypothetical protein